MISFGRILLGAMFGAGMLLFIIFNPNWLLGIRGVVSYIGISFGAVIITFGRKNVGKVWLLSTTIMILLGGGMNFLKYRLGWQTLDFGMWFGLFMVCSLAIHLFRFSIQNQIQNQDVLYRVRLRFCERQLEGVFLMDTGNFLFDPLFQRPVVLIGEEFAKKILNAKEKQILEEYKREGYLLYSDDRNDTKAYFHEIGFQSVGEKSGKLICFLVDEFIIQDTNHVLLRQPVAIALEPIFNGKTYQGLLQESLL